MDVLEYEKARIRMCRTMILEKGGCEACPMYNVLKRKCEFTASVIQNPDIDTIKNNVDRVIKWAKDHPAKTRQSEFLKRFPNAKLDINGVLAIRPCDIDSKCCTDDDYLIKCGACAEDYWLTEVTNDD